MSDRFRYHLLLAALETHRFNKGLGVCGCGWESLGRGTRTNDHREHLAGILATPEEPGMSEHAPESDASPLAYLRQLQAEADKGFHRDLHAWVDDNSSAARALTACAEKDAGTVSPLTGRLRPPFDEERAAEFIAAHVTSPEDGAA